MKYEFLTKCNRQFAVDILAECRLAGVSPDNGYAALAASMHSPATVAAIEPPSAVARGKWVMP